MVVAIVALGVLAPPALAAEADATPPDGTYTGFLSYGGHMGFMVGPGGQTPTMSELAQRVGGPPGLLVDDEPDPVPDSLTSALSAAAMRWTGSAVGPVEARIQDGNLDGAWSVRGWGQLQGAVGLVNPQGPAAQTIMEISGLQTTVASGALAGPLDGAQLTGDESTDTAMHMDGAFPLGLVDDLQTTTVTRVSEPVHDVLVGCNVLTARFDRDIRAGIDALEGLGFDQSLVGQLVLIRAGDTTDEPPSAPPLDLAPLAVEPHEQLLVGGSNHDAMALLAWWAAKEMESFADACPDDTGYLELTAAVAREQVRRVQHENEWWSAMPLASAIMTAHLVPAASSGIGTTELGRAELAKAGEAIHRAINDMETARTPEEERLTDGARTYLLSMVAHLRLDEL